MSESRLNFEAINTYSEVVGKKVCEEFFKTKKQISGQEILNLPLHKQVNYFVLKNLFTQWQAESARLESPYFDYKNEDVKKSMQSLMNVLSKNILIAENNFLPLLNQSIAETLFIILSPYDYYHKNIEDSPAVTTRYLNSQAKYIRINKHLYMLLLDAMENEQDDRLLDKNAVFDKLDTIFKSTAEGPEDIEPHLEKFGAIEPVKVEDLFTEDNALSPSEEAEIDEIQNKLFQDFEEMDELAIEKSKQQLNDRFAKEETTINEKLASDTVDIATAHASKKVESLNKSISINQRYMFVKELFEGQSEAFDKAISEVEDCVSFEDAVGLLVQNYARNYHWNMQSAEIKDLLKVIIKKFK